MISLKSLKQLITAKA